MIAATIDDVTHVDELHSSWNLCVREWRGRLKLVKHKLLGAGSEGDALDRGSWGVVVPGGALSDADYKHAHVPSILAGGHARMDAALSMPHFQERPYVVLGSVAVILSYPARSMPRSS